MPRERCRGRGNGSGLWRVGGNSDLVEADYGESSHGIGFGVGLDTRHIDGLATGLDEFFLKKKS